MRSRLFIIKSNYSQSNESLSHKNFLLGLRFHKNITGNANNSFYSLGILLGRICLGHRDSKGVFLRSAFKNSKGSFNVFLARKMTNIEWSFHKGCLMFININKNVYYLTCIDKGGINLFFVHFHLFNNAPF